jgi:uncharacterized lipoprotein YbaY
MRLAAALALLLLAGCAREAPPPAPAAADTLEVSGDLLYRERVALPPGATATVALVELDRPGEAPLAETTFAPEGEVPLPFTLRVPAAALDTMRAYGLCARLEGEGGMRWTTHEPVPVLTRGHGRTAELLLRRIETDEGDGTPWVRARERGVTFRAVGQEPGWALDVYDAGETVRLDLLANYGEDRHTFDAAERAADEDGHTVYRATEGGRSIEVTLEDRACGDVMSGEAFEATVTVRLDGTTLSGCGRTLN